MSTLIRHSAYTMAHCRRVTFVNKPFAFAYLKLGWACWRNGLPSCFVILVGSSLPVLVSFRVVVLHTYTTVHHRDVTTVYSSLVQAHCTHSYLFVICSVLILHAVHVRNGCVHYSIALLSTTYVCLHLSIHSYVISKNFCLAGRT